jgi:hypothetical protein
MLAHNWVTIEERAGQHSLVAGFFYLCQNLLKTVVLNIFHRVLFEVEKRFLLKFGQANFLPEQEKKGPFIIWACDSIYQ